VETEQGYFEWLKENSRLFKEDQSSDLIDWLLVDEIKKKTEITHKFLSEDETTFSESEKHKLKLEQNSKTCINEFGEWFHWQRQSEMLPHDAHLRSEAWWRRASLHQKFSNFGWEIRNKKDQEVVIKSLRRGLISLMKDAIGAIGRRGEGQIVSGEGGDKVLSYLNFIKQYNIVVLDKNEEAEIDRVLRKAMFGRTTMNELLADRNEAFSRGIEWSWVSESDWRDLIDKLNGKE
jgi:hypothetical protein